MSRRISVYELRQDLNAWVDRLCKTCENCEDIISITNYWAIDTNSAKQDVLRILKNLEDGKYSSR